MKEKPCYVCEFTGKLYDSPDICRAWESIAPLVDMWTKSARERNIAVTTAAANSLTELFIQITQANNFKILPFKFMPVDAGVVVHATPLLQLPVPDEEKAHWEGFHELLAAAASSGQEAQFLISAEYVKAVIAELSEYFSKTGKYDPDYVPPAPPVVETAEPVTMGPSLEGSALVSEEPASAPSVKEILQEIASTPGHNPYAHQIEVMDKMFATSKGPDATDEVTLSVVNEDGAPVPEDVLDTLSWSQSTHGDKLISELGPQAVMEAVEETRAQLIENSQPVLGYVEDDSVAG